MVRTRAEGAVLLTIMKPNFSGEYVLNREASALSAAVAPNIQTASLSIRHDEPAFRCEGRFVFVSGDPVQWAFDLVTGGSELQWDEPALVCTMRMGPMTIVFRYELGDDGRLRLAEQLRGTDHDQDNLWVFDRR